MSPRMLMAGLFLLSCWTACTILPEERRPNKKKTNYCVRVLHRSADTLLLTVEQWEAVQSLFEANNLELDSLQFYAFQKPAYELDGYHVWAEQLVNGLPVFEEDVIFNFDTLGVYDSLQGRLIPVVDLDTVPTLARDTLLGRFLDLVEKDTFYIISGFGDSITKGCFEIELGYYDLHRGTADAEAQFVKTWMVKPQERAYPYALIADSAGVVLRYENGVKKYEEEF